MLSRRVWAVDETTSAFQLLFHEVDTVINDLLKILIIIRNPFLIKVFSPLHESNCMLLFTLLHKLFDRLLLNFNRSNRDKLTHAEHLLIIILGGKHEKVK
jgi:hypothetical protein